MSRFSSYSFSADAIEAHRSEVEAYLAKQLGCADTAQDIFQSIVENLLHRQTDTPLNNVRAYLYKAAQNALHNHYRGKEVRNSYLRDAVIEENTISPDQILAGEESLLALNAAISDLPLLTRQILIMHRVEGVSQREIATHFEIHLSTVEKRLKQALTYCLKKTVD